MLNLLGKQSDHPLANIKAAQQFLARLPTDVAATHLHEISYWAESVTDPLNKFRPDHQVAVLYMLEQAAHSSLRAVIKDYFSAQPGSTFQQNNLWKSMSVYFTQIGNAYLGVVRNYRKNEKGSSLIKSDIPSVCARGMTAVRGGLKCAAVRYAMFDAELWTGLAEFYTCAESRQLQDEAQVLDAELSSRFTIQQILAGTLIWQACGTGSLKPMQIHVAEQMITRLCDNFSVNETYIPGSVLAFDLLHAVPPMRLNGDSTLHPGLRFVSVSEAPQKIRGWTITLAKGGVPEELNFVSGYSTEILLEVSTHLARCLSHEQPLRRNPRRKFTAKVRVANGYTRLDELADTRWNPVYDDSEHWETQDISVNGFLCILPSAHAGKIRVGELIGLQAEKIERWGAGIVRRLSRDAEDNVMVGVEMLSNQLVGVVLHDDHPRAGQCIPGQRALYLNKHGSDSSEAWLLMQADTFTSKRTLEMTLDDTSYLLMPLELLRRGEDYDLGRYRKMVQDLGSSMD